MNSFHYRFKEISHIIIGGAAAFMLLLASCSNEAPPMAPAIVTRDSTSVMTTYGVSKLISDSGVIRYKLIAEEWKVYDKTNPSKQTFMKGIFLQKFDEKFHIDLYITADTAYWYNQNLWELRGRVCMKNQQGTIFRSEEVFWDMTNHIIYSNKFMHIITPEEELKGYSFRSNEQMTDYVINQSSGAFPMPENTNQNDSVKRESSKPQI